MPYTAVTLSQLQVSLQEMWETVPFWTSEEARLHINEALRVWNLLTGMWKSQVTVKTPSPTSPWITLPGSLVYNMRVEFLGKPVGYSSIGDLDYGRPNWEGETTVSGGNVPTTIKHWAPAGLRMIAIWPADSIGDRDLLVDGVATTPILINSGDFIDLGEEEHVAILKYALHVASFKKGGTTFSSTLPHYKEFLLACADRNERLKASLFFRRAMGLDLNRSQRPIRRPIAGQSGEIPEAASLVQPSTTSGG